MKKALLSLGTIAVVATPVVAVVSCSDGESSTVKYTLKGNARGIELTVENGKVTDVVINTFVIQSLDQLRDALADIALAISGDADKATSVFGSGVNAARISFDDEPTIQVRGVKADLIREEWDKVLEAMPTLKGTKLEEAEDVTIVHRVVLSGITSETITANFNKDFKLLSFSTTMMASGSGIEKALEAIRTSINANKDALLLNIDTQTGKYKEDGTLTPEDQTKFDEALEATMFNPKVDSTDPRDIDYVNAPSLFGKDKTLAPEHYEEFSKGIILAIINQPLDFDMATLLDVSSKKIVDNYRNEIHRDVVALEKAEVTARGAAIADLAAKPLYEAINSAYNAVVLDRNAKPLLDAYLEAIKGTDDEEKTNTQDALKQNQLGNELFEAFEAGKTNTLVKTWIDAKIAYIS